MTKEWRNELTEAVRPEKKKILSQFFKTGKGEYGEGDIFIGITVPDNRKIAITHSNDPLTHIDDMLQSEIHEHRLSALLALVHRYKKNMSQRDEVVKFYLDHTDRINNWDLVDLSAPYILGHHLNDNFSPTLLENLSDSDSIWERRIAIVSTWYLIRNGKFEPTLRLAKKYLNEKEPLLHKATGWMLREIGKRDEKILLDFLDAHAHEMPRTALRYAIERLSAENKTKYMTRRS